jgi:hypothetical protein
MNTANAFAQPILNAPYRVPELLFRPIRVSNRVSAFETYLLVPRTQTSQKGHEQPLTINCVRVEIASTGSACADGRSDHGQTRYPVYAGYRSFKTGS